jgi:LTXXQ motif family protein
MMMKIGAAALALFLTTSSATYAQAPIGNQPDRLNAAEFKELTDRRIEVIKAALQLKPDQEKYWPAVEEAIRARAAGRYARLENLLNQRGQQGEFNAIALMRRRAEALAQRSAELKKLADAWEPLQTSLDDAQKRRLRFLSLFVLREMRDRFDSRQMDFYDDDIEEN